MKTKKKQKASKKEGVKKEKANKNKKKRIKNALDAESKV